MISITIEGNAQQVREEMRALLGQDREAPEQPERAIKEDVPEKPKRTSRKTEPAKSDTIEAGDNAAASEKSNDATTSTTATTAASLSEERDLSEKAMRERITQYSAKAGPVALTEMQKTAGAPNGKFSEVMADPEALAKLDALLADAGF